MGLGSTFVVTLGGKFLLRISLLPGVHGVSSEEAGTVDGVVQFVVGLKPS